jgi:signal transduction histidine kinase
MRARARAIDATVHVSSRPGAGCSVQLCIPLAERRRPP